jgi:iron complex outermembrane receptor protein
VFVDNQTTGGIGLQLFTQIYKVGLAPNAFWVYQQIYDTNGRPIEGAYVDRDGNGVIDANDKYNYKKPQADVTMGFLTNATIFKNWDFSMAWRASIGNYVYDQVSSGRANLSAVYNSFTETISNTTTDYGDTQFVTGANRESDYYVKDGSFLKLDNITIGHNFKKLLNNDKTSLRLYTGVQNVLIITKYKGIDPEVFNNGIDNTIFPRARIFMLGVNANF